jgi:AAA domain
MITYLKLTNFKRHESLELNFSGGLQLIRAASEAGKSSMLQAIAYALYGARALPMSLAATVTYDKPESSLRVLLRFSFNGSEFEVERHKGGAELRGDGVTASGQAEVTAFVDRLFGCSAATATSLMFANQGALRGALEGGPGAAVSLIEKLADVDALDRLVEKAQEKLPSGNTKLIEARIAELQALERPVSDFSDLEQAVSSAEAAVEACTFKVDELEADIASRDVAPLDAAIAQAKQADFELQQGQATVARLQPVADQVVPDQLDLRPLRAAVEQGQQAATVAAQYQKFLSITQYDHAYASAEEATAKVAAINTRLAAIKKEALVVTRELAQAEMAIIKGDLCNFCGKSMQDIPEVIAKNAECRELATKAQARQAALNQEELALTNELDDINTDIAAATSLEREMARLPVDAFGGYPRKYKWVGGDILSAEGLEDAKVALRNAEAHNATAFKQSAAKQAALDTLATIDLPQLKAKAEQCAAASAAAQEQLKAIQTLRVSLKEATAQVGQATNLLASHKSALAVAQAEFSAALKSYNEAQANLAKAKSDLSTYVLNNRVIKKIRDARPLVAKQLWGTVLGTVSHYFSQVRGTPSLVTREGSGFLVDGKPVEGLSGSTLDALGLAIRIALTRTFLSNVPWLILDEPAAACDDNREAAMMGVVSGCGFPQVLMVSHSDLGEAYASNVITF